MKIKTIFCVVLLAMVFVACNSETGKNAGSTVDDNPVIEENDTNENSEQSSDLNVHVTNNLEDIMALCGRSKDTTYLVNFWATWCKPCVEELPYFFELEKKMEGKAFKLILVSLDFNEKAHVKYLAENDIRTECWHFTNMDYNSWISQIDETWSGAIPASLRCDEQAGDKFVEGSFHSYDEIYQWAVKE